MNTYYFEVTEIITYNLLVDAESFEAAQSEADELVALGEFGTESSSSVSVEFDSI